jgi:hypothetical protein
MSQNFAPKNERNCINSTEGADKSLARTNSPCTLFDGENISFYASLVKYK